MNILLTAKQRGSVEVLAPVARELVSRGHEVTIYATGNDNEATPFKDLGKEHETSPNLKYEHNEGLKGGDYSSLIKGYSAVVVGLSGYEKPDGCFLRAANAAGIPTVAAQDQNSNYRGRLGTDPEDLPTVLALMTDDCIETARSELGGEMGEEAARRSRVVGWTKFDNYAKMKEEFGSEDRHNLLISLGIDPDQNVHAHFTQNIHPLTGYMLKTVKDGVWDAVSDAVREMVLQRGPVFDYEMKITESVFSAASDLGLRLVVKPHPGEKYHLNFTEELARKHDFTFLDAGACKTQHLMLASYSISAGRSSCLDEAVLLDKNVGALLPEEMGTSWGHNACMSVALDAMPYTFVWGGIKGIIEQVTSKDEAVVSRLTEKRKKFSVDGKASKRFADLVEELGR